MNENYKILIVEDDPYIMKLCTIFLTDEKYGVLSADTGAEALRIFHEECPHLILLDLGLPDMDGMELISLIRTQSDVPIIVISARREESEKIRALDLGADDYMSKPFHTGELRARIRAARRRMEIPAAGSAESLAFSCRDLFVDFSEEKVTVAGALVHLTPIEYKLLRLLIKNRGKVLTHSFIQSKIWPESGNDPKDAQNLRVFMANLRRKIEPADGSFHYILTQVGVGYRFVE